jgi:hypothetical protein
VDSKKKELMVDYPPFEGKIRASGDMMQQIRTIEEEKPLAVKGIEWVIT